MLLFWARPKPADSVTVGALSPPLIAENIKSPIPGDVDRARFGIGIADVPTTSAELSSASGVPRIVIAGFPVRSVEPATTTPSAT